MKNLYLNILINGGLVSIFINLFLGLFVYFKNKKNPINFRFCLFSLSIAFWSVGSFLVNIIPQPGLAVIVTRCCYLAGVFLPPFYFHFMCECVGQARARTLSIKIGYGLSSLLSVPLLFSAEFLKGLRFLPNSHYPISIPGPFYYVFIVFFFFYITWGLFLMVKAALIATGNKKNQYRYMLIAQLIAAVASVDYFLCVFKVFNRPALDDYILVGHFSLMSYAIVRHRLMDIEVIIKRTLVFAGIVASAVALISLPFVLAQTLIGRALGIPNPFILMALGIMTTVLIYRPVDRVLVNLTDKYLFQKKFNLTSIVAQAGEAIALVQSLKWLSKRIVAFLVTKCRIKSALVYIQNRGSKHFERGAIRGYKQDEYPVENLEGDYSVIQYLRETRRVIEKNRIDEDLQKKDFSEDVRKQYEEIKNFLQRTKSEVIIPSFLRRRIDVIGIGKEKESEGEVLLRSILVLGGKKSDEPYSEDELEVFYGLAQESAIAIENARLYDEVVERTQLLAKMNTELSEANEKLKVTQASLIVAEKNSTMVGMAKAIGHEVNNPLSTVAGRAVWIYKDELRKCRDVIARNFGTVQEPISRELEKRFHNIEDNAKRIEKSSKRIEVVVKTLTDILKDTKGERGPLSLLVLCREAREATRFLTYDENLSGCHIVENIASNIVILGNLEQLLQVFINMIKNAYEAMIGQQERRIEIKGNIDPDNDKMARIEFIDNGPGVPEDVLPKIWGQGFSTKIKKEETIGAAGQGQGLFICKHVIESIHNGEIYAESAPGKGTTFVIKVPLADLEG